MQRAWLSFVAIFQDFLTVGTLTLHNSPSSRYCNTIRPEALRKEILILDLAMLESFHNTDNFAGTRTTFRKSRTILRQCRVYHEFKVWCMEKDRAKTLIVDIRLVK